MNYLNSLFLLVIFVISTQAQPLEVKTEQRKTSQIDPTTGNNKVIQSASGTATDIYGSPFISSDCTNHFYSVNANGEIQQWSLTDNEITGGDIILTDCGNSLSYSLFNSNPTFFSGQYPSQGLTYHGGGSDWQDLILDEVITNNGGHNEHMFFMGLIDNSNKGLYYLDGTEAKKLEELQDSFYTVFDVPVDTLGRAWMFTGTGATGTEQVRVFDASGYLFSYDIQFQSVGTYGAFALGSTIYVAGDGDIIRPLILNNADSTATLGTSIVFTQPTGGYYDLASCANSEGMMMSLKQQLEKNNIKVYPNPTDGFVVIESEEALLQVEIYNELGQLIFEKKTTDMIDLTAYPSGLYCLKIKTENGIAFKRIVKL